MKQSLLSLSLLVIGGTTASVYGQSAAATWEMTQTTATGASVSGPLLASDLIIEGGKNYGYNATDSKFSTPTMAIANMANATTAAEDPEYYIEYAVTPKEGITFTAEELSFYICGKGGSNVRANFYYSKDHSFLQKTKIAYREDTDLTRDNAVGFEQAIVPMSETLAFGDTLYFRIYPYYKSVSSGKYVCPRDIVIKGSTAGEATVDPAQVQSHAEVTYISTTTAIFGGAVLSDGGGNLLGKGIVWNKTGNATIADSKTEEALEIGSFDSEMSGLEPGTTYYTRAYATNKSGTYYGQEVAFSTLSALTAPKVTTPTASKISNNSASFSYQLSAWGGTEVLACGIVYSASANMPSLDDASVMLGTALGKYTLQLNELQPETTYYVRSYATNSVGTAYSTNVCTFTTKATDPDVTRVIDPAGNGDYTSVKEAFAAVPSGYTGKWIIRIKPGIYDERVVLASDRTNVWLMGENAETTIITGNATAGTIGENGAPLGTNGSMTVAIDADDFVASRITIRNTFVNSNENVQINSNTQAVALRTKGDRQAYYDCRIEGYHDTFYGNSEGRVYFKNCYIEGNVDFIFGNSTVVFDQCTAYANRNESVITAPSTAKTTLYGMVFLDCKITSLAQNTPDFNGAPFKGFYLGRPWQNQPKSAFIRCEMPGTLYERGWTTMNAGLNPVFVEGHSYGDGATAEHLAKRGCEGIVIDHPQTAGYTVENIFAKTTSVSFGANWLPAERLPDDIVNSIGQTAAVQQAKVTASPSAFTDICTLSIELDQASPVSIRLININGSVVMSEELYLTAGNHNYVIDGTTLNQGIYFYQVQLGKTSANGKIIRK